MLQCHYLTSCSRSAPHSISHHYLHIFGTAPGRALWRPHPGRPVCGTCCCAISRGSSCGSSSLFALLALSNVQIQPLAAERLPAAILNWHQQAPYTSPPAPLAAVNCRQGDFVSQFLLQLSHLRAENLQRQMAKVLPFLRRFKLFPHLGLQGSASCRCCSCSSAPIACLELSLEPHAFVRMVCTSDDSWSRSEVTRRAVHWLSYFLGSRQHGCRQAARAGLLQPADYRLLVAAGRRGSLCRRLGCASCASCCSRCRPSPSGHQLPHPTSSVAAAHPGHSAPETAPALIQLDSRSDALGAAWPLCFRLGGL